MEDALNSLDNSSNSRYRTLNFLGMLVCAGALLFAVIYLQQRLGLVPCPLCIITRIVILSMGGLFFLAWIQNPRQLGQRCYAILGGLLGCLGAGLNLRHIWLQSLPSEQLAECGLELEQLLQNLPLLEVVSSLLSGSGECNRIQWTLAGLTLPQLTLMLFLFLLLILIVQFRKKRRSYFS